MKEEIYPNSTMTKMQRLLSSCGVEDESYLSHCDVDNAPFSNEFQMTKNKSTMVTLLWVTK